MAITNPILTGFNPDPSIIKVGVDYYIATSTFEWFPGVQIHHSTDLVNWELVARPLNRKSQLDMLGVPDSCGVWAPCLSYHNGTFYLVYSNAKSFEGVWKDTPNFLVTTNNIIGDWSEPIFLSSGGFDGSLFHDQDGKKWYTSLLLDHRKNKFFGGIFLQEFDVSKQRLIGRPQLIFEGTHLGRTEGPHLYLKDGYYYLLTAEGGTEYGHAVTMARSKNIRGPYEIHPSNPLISTRENIEHPLQKTGHADIVKTEEGNWLIVFLMARPLSEKGRCTLGRETAIEELDWKQGEWPVLKIGGREPRIEVPIGTLSKKVSQNILRDDFENNKLDLNWQSLRVPIDNSWLRLDGKRLTLLGRESLSSTLKQSLIGRRVQHFNIEATTSINFKPETFQQLAGLTCYYNSYHFHYLYLTADFDGSNKSLNIISCNKYEMSEPLSNPIQVGTADEIFLKANFNHAEIQFSYSIDNKNWKPIGPLLDASILSDDYVRDEKVRYRPAFTGAFIALCCQDLEGLKRPAHFNWFEYKIIL